MDDLLTLAGRGHRSTETLHSLIYFSPEAEQCLVEAGLRPGRMCYFASRAATLGAVGPSVVAATFYNFNPELIARHIPRAWTLAEPSAILAARLRGADVALRTRLGDATVEGPEVAEAAALARIAAEDLPVAGRPLFAGHAQLPWPDEPHLVLWHAASLLREFRGDGHIAALLLADLSGIEAIVTHTATGRGFRADAGKLLRGWSDEQWSAAEEGLRSKGILDADGALTESGRALRERLEAQTDAASVEGYRRLGPDRAARLVELGKGLSRIAVVNGAYPQDVFSSR